MPGPVLMFLLTFSPMESYYVPAKWPGIIATPIGAGEPAYLGWARPGLWKLRIKAGGPLRWSGPPSAEASPQAEGAHSFALTVGRVSLTQLKSLS